MTCIVENCDRPYVSRKLCIAHYSRWRRGKDLHTPLRRPRSVRGCDIDGCDKPHSGHGLCKNHLRKKRLYGDPLKSRYDGPYNGALCKIKECKREAKSRSYCLMHYKNWKTHGDPRHSGIIRVPRAGICKVESCNDPRKNKGYCSKHYSRLYSNGDPHIVRKNYDSKNTVKICTVDGCNGKHFARKMCSVHYSRWKMRKLCIIPGCKRKQKGYGFCIFHRNVDIPFNTRLKLWQVLLFKDSNGFIDKADMLSVCNLKTKNTTQKSWERLKQVLDRYQIKYDIEDSKIKIYMNCDLLDWWYTVLTEGKKKRVYRVIYAA